jgi:V8-like Glu-specific endopeptidase
MLLGPKLVLTSAHCIANPGETFIVAGMASFILDLPNVPSSYANGQMRKVAEAKTHENFTEESKYDYDVGLALLDEELTLGGTACTQRLLVRAQQQSFRFRTDPQVGLSLLAFL